MKPVQGMAAIRQLLRWGRALHGLASAAISGEAMAASGRRLSSRRSSTSSTRWHGNRRARLTREAIPRPPPRAHSRRDRKRWVLNVSRPLRGGARIDEEQSFRSGFGTFWITTDVGAWLYCHASDRAGPPALARHFREAEGPSISQIVHRLARSPATVKAHFYSPTGEKARAVTARHVAVPLRSRRRRGYQ